MTGASTGPKNKNAALDWTAFHSRTCRGSSTATLHETSKISSPVARINAVELAQQRRPDEVRGAQLGAVAVRQQLGVLVDRDIVDRIDRRAQCAGADLHRAGALEMIH